MPLWWGHPWFQIVSGGQYLSYPSSARLRNDNSALGTGLILMPAGGDAEESNSASPARAGEEKETE